MTDEGWVPPVPPPPVEPARAPARASDGEQLITLQIRRKHVVRIIGPIVGLLFGSGGLATWKSFSAQDAAEEAQAKATVVATKTDFEADKSYEALRRRTEEDERDIAKQATTLNDVITRLGLLERLVLQESSARGAAAYKARKKPTPAPVAVPVKPPLPATPEAAAAAAPATPTSAGDKKP